MKRLEEGWFSFGGISNENMGLRLLEMPKRRKAKKRGNYQTASGRDGDMWDSDDAYEAYDITIKCESGDSYNEDDVRTWLDGENDLIFSDEPNLVYDALIREYVDFASKYQLFDTKLVTISVHVQPFRRMHPPVPPKSIYSSGTSFPNPGTVYSLPRVEIRGKGNFSVTIGAETLYFSDIVDGVIVDSELMDAISLDGSMSLNNNMSGRPYRIQPGPNVVSWETDDGSSVDSVTITPRWRCL